MVHSMQIHGISVDLHAPLEPDRAAVNGREKLNGDPAKPLAATLVDPLGHPFGLVTRRSGTFGHGLQRPIEQLPHLLRPVDEEARV